jgi:hypothetical protein
MFIGIFTLSLIQGPGWLNELVVGIPNNSDKPITNTAWDRAGFVNYKKGALDSQPEVIKFTSCLSMRGVAAYIWQIKVVLFCE